MRTAIALALLAAIATPAAGADLAPGAPLCIWGKRATLVSGPMASGREGYDALYVRFAGKTEPTFVLQPRGTNPGCGIPTADMN